jgi:hypothetical protein
MAESPERMGRFRRMVDVAAEFDVAEEEEDVAKDRLAGTKAYYRMVSLWYRYYLWESSSSSGKMDKKEFVSEFSARDHLKYDDDE